MINQHISQIIQRDLSKAKDELHLYTNQDTIWKVVPGISNSAGNLCLHLVGNLRHFIGAELGHTGYVRNRDLEFSQKEVDLKELDALIDITLAEVGKALEQMDHTTLSKEFPKDIGGVKRDTLFVLLHLLSHLNYHLGQSNYHRRIVSSLEM